MLLNHQKKHSLFRHVYCDRFQTYCRTIIRHSEIILTEVKGNQHNDTTSENEMEKTPIIKTYRKKNYNSRRNHNKEPIHFAKSRTLVKAKFNESSRLLNILACIPQFCEWFAILSIHLRL